MRVVFSFWLTILLTGITVPWQAVHAQISASLSIISPPNETVVQPGQSIQIMVATANPSEITSEAIVGTNPIGTSPDQSAAANTVFNLVIPENIRAGRYYIRAFAGVLGGGTVRSNAVSIVVPFTAPVTALRVSNNPLVLSAPGDIVTLDVTAATSQGAVTMDPEKLSFVSADSGVASVDGNGNVTAQGAGRTQITITYGSQNNATSTAVNVETKSGGRGDLNGDGRVDIDDLNIMDMWLNTSANGPNDARDLNHDGKIDALDARILTTLCTYPRCASRP